MYDTLPLLRQTSFPRIRRKHLETLQVNIGLRCNLKCVHCHTNSGPRRNEAMSRKTVDLIINYLKASGISTLDITGGAPELHPDFRYLVQNAGSLGVHVIDRCNLTVLEERGQEDLAEFLVEQGVEIIASLPCYTRENVDGQRGKGVFDASIRVLKRLNALGYGIADHLPLHLVYNPLGPYLPPPQAELERDFKRVLGDEYGIHFHRLYTLANMPIKRFGHTLIARGEFDQYMKLLERSHRDENLERVMCRTLISVDWQGYIYDCDFNQMLGLGMCLGGKPKIHLSDLISRDIEGTPILVGYHCYGCTAGQGSSCGGALTP